MSLPVDPRHAARRGAAVMRLVDEIFPLVEGLYVDLHRNPELSHQEHRTARAVAEWLARAGFEVTTGVGGTGVVGVLRNGVGPTVLLRGDMDALPVEERTELPYASTARGTDDEGNDVPVTHARGHDAHTACLVGAADLLAGSREQWRGTVMVVAQPAEETLTGAAAMVRDGLYERFGRPDVALAQQVCALPAGTVAHRSGAVLAASDVLRVRVIGAGGNSARPHTTVDPVVIAAGIVTRLRTAVAQEVAPTEAAVATVGVLRAGSRAGVVPDEAYLEINTRALSERVAERLRTVVERVARAEAQAAGAPKDPEITRVRQAGAVANDPDRTTALATAHRAYLGEAETLDLPVAVLESEDFGEFGLPSSTEPVPYVYWFLGSTALEEWERAPGESVADKLSTLSGDHSPLSAVDRETTLRTGMAALTVGALACLGRSEAPERAGDADSVSSAATTSEMAAIPVDAGGGGTPEWAAAEAMPGAGPSQADTGPAPSLAPAEPPSGPAFPAPPPQGPPIVAPPPPEDSEEPPYRL